MFSILTVIFIENKVIQKEMSFHWENEQIITRLFQAYTNGKSLNEIIENDYSTINSLGFYNFYGDPLYTYGNARDKFNNVTRKVNINKKNSTIMIERDFFSPFDPTKRIFEPNRVTKGFKPRNEWSPADKENLIRYVTIDVYNDIIIYFKIRFKILQILTILLLLILVLFLVHIYKKNMNYRNQIEDSKRLVVLGTAARTLSHEIKNPLSIIRLQSSIIKRSGGEKYDSSLKIVNDEILRITELTERVTDFLRHPSGYPERLDITKILKEYLSKNKPITLYVPEEDCLLYMDKNRFISIIDNVINNAIESGSPIENVEILLEIIGNNIQIKVSDKGHGIAKDDLESLLDPFFTTKSKGSGLGLSIVSSYVNAVKGSVKINSELGRGTDIIIVIPRYKIVKEVQQ